MSSQAVEQADQASSLIKDLSSLQPSLLKDGDTTRQEMLAKARSLISTLETPMESILYMGMAEPSRTAAIRISIDIGLFEKLSADNGKAKTSEQLANATKTDPALVGRILKHLASMSIVHEVSYLLRPFSAWFMQHFEPQDLSQEGNIPRTCVTFPMRSQKRRADSETTKTSPETYAPTPLSNALTNQLFYDGIVCLFDVHVPTFARLPAYFRSTKHLAPTDQSAFKYCNGTELGIFEWLAANPRMQTAFQNHMAGYSIGRPHWMDEGFYPVSERLEGVGEGEVLLVDVGGATGHDLAEFHHKCPTISGKLILQDQTEAISSIQEGERPGIACTVHDFFTPQPVKGAKAYFMHSVLHDWSDDKSRKILTHLKDALKPGYSKILINENVVDDQGASWKVTAFDWTMMALAGSFERTETQWRGLVGSVGLKISGIWKGKGATESLIEVVLADEE